MRIVAVVFALFVAGSAAGQGWQRDTFVGIPATSDPTKLGANWPGFSKELSVQPYTPDALEDGLNYAAGIFGKIGLTEPFLEPNLNDRNGFFVLNINPNLGQFSPDCQKPDHDRSLIELNGPLLATKPGRTTTSTVAHELFHAVQHHYPFTKAMNDPCVSPPAWIEEGQADAVGTFLAEEIWKISGPGADLHADEFGLRHYFLPVFEDLVAWKDCYDSFCLTQTKDFNSFLNLENYHSSSFWRFLMERTWEVRNEAYVHDSLQTLALFMAFSPPDQTAHFRASNRKGKQPSDAWLDWVAGIVNSMFGQAKSDGSGNNPAFHFVVSEFLTEFASWPLSKYKKSKLSTDTWLQTAFNKCRKVRLKPKETHTEDYSKGNDLGETPIYPVSGRCIEVTLEGFVGQVKLDIAAHAASDSQSDQLMLGLAYETDGSGTAVKTCYENAAGEARGEYGCLYFGKVGEWYSPPAKSGSSPARYTRTWRFEPRVMNGNTIVQTFVLSNVLPDKPSETEAIEELEVSFSTDYVQDNTGKQGFHIPESTVPAVPDLSTPQRDLFYGIQSRGTYSSLFPVNMAPFGFETLAKFPVKKGAVSPDGEARVVPAFFGPKPNPGNEPRGISYGILPLDEVAFGQLGALQGVVSRTDPSQPDRPAMSTLCAGADNTKPLEVLQSDRAALRVRVNTPICTSLTGDFLDCQNGCPVVETLDVTVSLAGGWRYFKETQPGDIITPSVRYDIDRFHHEVYGEPLRLAPLPDLNNVPPGGFRAPVQSAASARTTSAAPPCDCSCQGFDAIQQLQKTPALMLLPGNMQKLQCMGTCMSQYAACK